MGSILIACEALRKPFARPPKILRETSHLRLEIATTYFNPKAFYYPDAVELATIQVNSINHVEAKQT